MLVVWAGLMGAGAPAFACATAAASGDCCPPGAPTGCTQVYEQLDLEASVCCITAVAPAQIVATESGRELLLKQHDHESADPVVLAAPPCSLPDPGSTSRLDGPHVSAAYTDASLTYLHTGRLRL
jgi:hypothetical protein